MRELGLAFTCLSPPESAEPLPFAGEDAGEYALRAAWAKAESVLPYAGPPPCTILAADTVVALDGRILGKPRDAEEAYAMLRLLAGRTHTVVSGCAIRPPSGPPAFFAVRSAVTMWDCPEPVIRAYANSGEPLDKAGAYAVQGAGAFLVERIEGSWSNVVGLPLAELVREMLRLGALCVRG